MNEAERILEACKRSDYELGLVKREPEYYEDMKGELKNSTTKRR